MAIIPLIVEGEHKNIVDLQEEFDLNGNKIRISNCDKEQLTEINEANTSYDFRVGGSYLDHREKNQITLGDKDKIKLKPGMAVIIQTEEYVHFPKTRFGQIVPKVTLLRKGISNTTSKIDPGYNGKLLVTVFNLGQNTEFLSKGDKFCTLIVHDVFDEGIRHYNKPAKELQSDYKKNYKHILKDIINWPFWGIIAFIITTLVAISAIIFN